MPETRRKRGEYGSKYHILRCPYCNHVLDKNDEENNHVSIVYSFGFECLIECEKCGDRFYFKAFRSGYTMGLLNEEGLIYKSIRKREAKKREDDIPINSPVMNTLRAMLSENTEALNNINVLQFKYCISLFKKWCLIDYYKIFRYLEYFENPPCYEIEDKEARAKFLIQPDYKVRCEFHDCYVTGRYRNNTLSELIFWLDFRYEYDHIAVCKYDSNGTFVEMNGGYFRPEISYTFITLMKQLKSYKAFLLGQDMKPKQFLTNQIEDSVGTKADVDMATVLQSRFAIFKKTLHRFGLVKEIGINPEVLDRTKKDVARYEKMAPEKERKNKMIQNMEIANIFEKILGVDMCLEKALNTEPEESGAERND